MAKIGFRYAAVAVTVAAVVSAPSPAWAHTELLATTPGAGSTVTTAVPAVTLTFSGLVRARGTLVVVTGPDGADHADGPVSVRDGTVTQRVRPLPAGTVTVKWRVVAGDGDPAEGSFAFAVGAGAGVTAPSTSVAATTVGPAKNLAAPAAPPGWLWLIAAGSVLLVAAVVVVWPRPAPS